MADHVTLHGLDSTIRAMRMLPRELQGTAVRGGLAAAGRLLRDEMRKNAPKRSGNLAKQIFLYRDRNPGALGLAEHYIISVRTGRRGLGRLKLGQAVRALTGTDAWYWFFVEFGTSKQPEQSFMRRGFESQSGAALQVFGRVFTRGVDRAVERARRASGGR